MQTLHHPHQVATESSFFAELEEALQCHPLDACNPSSCSTVAASHAKERSRCFVHFNSPKSQKWELRDYLDLELLSVEHKCLCLASPSRGLHLITPLDQAQEAVLLHLPSAA